VLVLAFDIEHWLIIIPIQSIICILAIGASTFL
jgi:hypothetical protein